MNRTPQQINDAIRALTNRPDLAANLARTRQRLSTLGGAAGLADRMTQV